MSEKRSSVLRRWLPSVAAGAVYGLVWAVGLILLGREPMLSIAVSLLGATAWAAMSIWVRGPLTRWRDRRLEQKHQKTDEGD